MKLDIKGLTINYFRFYEDGFCVGWSANIGFGRMDFIYDENSHSFKIDSECMCSNYDKTFAKMVLEKAKEHIIKKSEVRG